MQPPPKYFCFFNMHIWYKNHVTTCYANTTQKHWFYNSCVLEGWKWMSPTGLYEWKTSYGLQPSHKFSFEFIFFLVCWCSLWTPKAATSQGYWLDIYSLRLFLWKTAFTCGRVLAWVSFRLTSTRWVWKWATDKNSKGSECPYESRFVQNVLCFSSSKRSLFYTLWYVKTAINKCFVYLLSTFFYDKLKRSVKTDRCLKWQIPHNFL